MQILAHGGAFTIDELILVAVVMIFTLFLFLGWYKSREFKPELNEDSQQAEER